MEAELEPVLTPVTVADDELSRDDPMRGSSFSFCWKRQPFLLFDPRAWVAEGVLTSGLAARANNKPAPSI